MNPKDPGAALEAEGTACGGGAVPFAHRLPCHAAQEALARGAHKYRTSQRKQDIELVGQ